MFDRTTNSKGVLRSETYLNTSYQPEEPVGRDAEVKRIADAVRPLARGKRPENLLVHGPAGVGKTTPGYPAPQHGKSVDELLSGITDHRTACVHRRLA